MNTDKIIPAVIIPASIAGLEIRHDGCEFSIVIPDATGELTDHFPGNILIPGFVLVDWVCWILQTHFGVSAVNGIKDVKFLTPVVPPTTIRGKVTLNAIRGLAEVTMYGGLSGSLEQSSTVCFKGNFQVTLT